MKRKVLITSSIVLVMLTVFTINLFLQTETRTSLELTRVMPGGALAYVEFEDLGNLLGQWQSSAAHKRYLESANWKEFQNARLYLRLRQRLEPIEAALGFELTEQRLATMAGRQSALGVYDVGRLEMLFITAMPRQEALTSTLFKQRKIFREHTLDGVVYYVREGIATESQEKAVAGFTLARGMMFVASSETLLRRAIMNVTRQSEDRLSVQISRLTENLSDFQPHDITVWLDQKRLNADRYFRNYWIHYNQSEMADSEAALLDLEITPNEFRERRWFRLSETATKGQSAINSLNELQRFAPAETTLLTVDATRDIRGLGSRAVEVLLGETPTSTPSLAHVAYSPSGESTFQSRPSVGAWRYAALDDRFLKDIDDPTSFVGPSLKSSQPSETVPDSGDHLATQLTNLLGPAEPVEFMNLSEAMLGENHLFVAFHRALVIRLSRPDAFEPEGLERIVREEFITRYIVQGVPARLEWKISGNIHSLNQAALDRSSAYALTGNYLILANRADYCQRILQAYSNSTAPTSTQSPSLQRYVQVRIQPGHGIYKHVMGMLASPGMNIGTDESVDLFRDNIASLIEVVPELSEVTIETVQAAPLRREVATYRFEKSNPPSPRRIKK